MDSLKNTKAGSYSMRPNVSTPPRKKFLVFRALLASYTSAMKFALSKPCSGRRPTLLGGLVLLLLTAIMFLVTVKTLYPFLAPTAPPHRGVMVVEGWIHDQALSEAVRLYRTGSYSHIVCTGVPLETGSYLAAFNSYPEMTAARLRHLGINPAHLLVAIGRATDRDRTYTAALALRERLKTENIIETDIHLVTVGPHGRRSRALFRKALGPDYAVGVTSLPDLDYDARRWYAYSAGFRKTIGEWIAYTYTLFFHP